MKNFLERNKSVFWIGLLTLFIFLVIIALSQKEEAPETTLIRVDENRVGFEKTDPLPPVSENMLDTMQALERLQETSESTETREKELANVVYITYNGQTFEPKRAVGYVGQVAIWKNLTNNPMILAQIVKKFDSLKNPVVVGPGDEYLLELTDHGMWNYEEAETNTFGSILIKELD